jgi:hypothetical protein
MRGAGCELRGREGGGGEQHEAKFCHDSPKILGKNWIDKQGCLSAERIGATINGQPLGRIVAAIKCVVLLFWQCKRLNARSFIAHSAAWFALPWLHRA